MLGAIPVPGMGIPGAPWDLGVDVDLQGMEWGGWRQAPAPTGSQEGQRINKATGTEPDHGSWWGPPGIKWNRGQGLHEVSLQGSFSEEGTLVLRTRTRRAGNGEAWGIFKDVQRPWGGKWLKRRKRPMRQRAMCGEETGGGVQESRGGLHMALQTPGRS